MRHCLTALLLLTAGTACIAQTALEDYVGRVDAAYAFREYAEQNGVGWTTHFIKLTSQRWRGADDVDCDRRLQGSWLDACDLWQHELILYVPMTLRLGPLGGAGNTAVLIVTGGDNTGDMTRDGSEFGGPLALLANAVVAELRQVPNQPYYFADEQGRERREDALLGYSIDKFFEDGDAGWPALAPMTKAAVMAMDTVQAFIRDEYAFGVMDFAVTGGSKRGWTTWLAAAVDDRVKAMMPASIEVNELSAQLRHHHAGYGFFAAATADYIEANLPCQLERPEADTLREVIDPGVYRDRYTMPKLLLNSTGDQFFSADASRFYFSGLPGPKRLRMAPNTDHGQNADSFSSGLLWLLDAIEGRTPGPALSWTTGPDGSLRVSTGGGEQDVYLWRAENPRARDFRLESIGEAWVRTPLAKDASGDYVAPADAPAAGWAAQLVEVVYDTVELAGLGEVTESYTTEVRVVPDTLPHEPFDCSRPLEVTEGMWWDPDTSGQGMDINRFNRTVIFGPWYLYDAAGKPFWATFTGDLEGTRARGVLHEFTGPRFRPGIDIDYDKREVSGGETGQATIAFLGRDHGVFHYGFGAARGGVRGVLDIEQFDYRPDGPRSGHWWNPDQSGQGFQFSHKENVFFGTWYTYDEAGNPLWFLYIGEMLDADSAWAELHRFTGPPLGDEPWDKSLVLGEVVGELRVDFPADNEAVVDITVDGVMLQYRLQPFEAR